jgi:hypothetical protein
MCSASTCTASFLRLCQLMHCRGLGSLSIVRLRPFLLWGRKAKVLCLQMCATGVLTYSLRLGPSAGCNDLWPASK